MAGGGVGSKGGRSTRAGDADSGATMADPSGVDAMSAAELRTKLAEFGLPVMPITASTRALMVKKLKMLMSGKAAKGSRSLARYSSGEDSEPEERRTSRRSMPPPAARPRRSQAPRPEPEPEPERDAEPEPEPEKRSPRRPRPVAARARVDDYETGSDSDLGADGEPDPPPPPTVPRFAARPSSFVSYSSPLRPPEDLDSIRSRLGLASTRPTIASVSAASPREDLESPYLSVYARRLSAVNAEARERLERGEANGARTAVPAAPPAYARRPDPPADFRVAGEKNVSKNNLVSLAIVGAGVAFFLVVAFTYVGMKGEPPFDPDAPDAFIPICAANINSQLSTYNCVLRNRVAGAKDLLRAVRPELIARAVAVACGAREGPARMTDGEIVHFVAETLGDREKSEVLTDLYNAQVLALGNPKWGFSVVRTNPAAADVVLTSMDYVAPARSKGQTGLAVDPPLPASCLLIGKLRSLAIALAATAVLVGALYGGRRAVAAMLARRRRREAEVYALVERIVEFVSREADDDGDGVGRAVALGHVRDALVAPRDRDRKAAVWDAAVAFVEKNESRVRFEVTSVAGEEHRSLRWVSPRAGSKGAARGGARAWQGQAFETQRGSVNNLAFSPTPCLKIRHMVDKNDKNPELKTVVRDAILEKCGPQCRILHVEIDEASCCVFVKCASPADAGVVYRSLHGWWYEGNLITVKYLRLERYADHFPDSPSSGPPYLKPSGQ